MEKTFNSSVYHILDQQGCVRTKLWLFLIVEFILFDLTDDSRKILPHLQNCRVCESQNPPASMLHI